MRDVSVQNHLEAGQRAVAQGAVDEGAVRRSKRGDVHVVVQHDGPATHVSGGGNEVAGIFLWHITVLHSGALYVCSKWLRVGGVRSKQITLLSYTTSNYSDALIDPCLVIV